MKKLISTGYTNITFNLATFILRAIMGILMIPHGYDKLVHFSSYKKDFLDLMGMGSVISLALAVFAEFFCCIFLVMGLFTRIAAFFLIVLGSVAIIKIHHGDIFSEGETITLFLTGFLSIILLGPGKISLDGILSK